LSLPILKLLLRVVGFPTLYRVLSIVEVHESICRSCERASHLNRARRLADLVGLASRFSFFSANCLNRSLALLRLLNRKGIPAELVIGVRKSETGLDAHAWVEVDNESLDSRSIGYLPFDIDHMSEAIATFR